MSDNHRKTTELTECSVMLALSIVLSFVTVWKMPMGGEVTLLSMLPLSMISVKYGLKQGLATAFLFSLFHLVKGIAGGNVFVYCTTAYAIVICVLFDYLMPFTLLGLSGIFRKKGVAGITAGIALTMVCRFLCHFVTGFTIWGQWAEEGQSKYVYSLFYNGPYMLAECILTCAAFVILTRIPKVKELLNIGK